MHFSCSVGYTSTWQVSDLRRRGENKLAVFQEFHPGYTRVEYTDSGQVVRF